MFADTTEGWKFGMNEALKCKAREEEEDFPGSEKSRRDRVVCWS